MRGVGWGVCVVHKTGRVGAGMIHLDLSDDAMVIEWLCNPASAVRHG